MQQKSCTYYSDINDRGSDLFLLSYIFTLKKARAHVAAVENEHINKTKSIESQMKKSKNEAKHRQELNRLIKYREFLELSR